jgi:hypothetical protein
MSAELLVYLFLAVVAVSATVGLFAPRLLLQRKGPSWFFEWMEGRGPYSSVRRVRFTCTALLLVVVALILVSVFFPG